MKDNYNKTSPSKSTGIELYKIQLQGEYMGKRVFKSQLKALVNVEQEIKESKRRIERLKGSTVIDTVKGSNIYYPYEEIQITIQGRPSSIARQERALEKQIEMCEELRADILEFVSTIDNPMVRRIIKLKYIEGFTWRRVSKVFGSSDESYARKTLDRYLDKL